MRASLHPTRNHHQADLTVEWALYIVHKQRVKKKRVIKMPGRVDNGSAVQVNRFARDAESLRIGQTLKDLRAARRLTQQDLADQLGISASYLSLLESSKRRTTRKILRGLSEYLKLPAGYLVIHAMEVRGLEPRHQELIQELERELVGPALERAFAQGANRPGLALEASKEAKQARH